MSLIDIQSLLKEISAESPCGEDLEYDAEFTEMERAAQGKPEQQVGDTVIPAEEPNWPTVKDKAIGLFGRTKDLRVAFYLTHSLLHTDGLSGFRDGLALIQGLMEQYWDTVHPQLDPDDNNDPTLRINTLTQLCDPVTVLHGIREAPLVVSKGFGRISFRNVLIVTGKLSLPASSDEQPVESATINGAFMDGDIEELKSTSDAIRESIDAVSAIEAVMMEKVGAMQTADVSALPDLLKEAYQIMSEHLVQRGVSSVEALDESEQGAGGTQAGMGQAIPGAINSREDAIRMLDKVCDYFKQHEPSSPVPLLLQRAKRLVAKDFLEILRDLTPAGVAQAEEISGVLNHEQ